jgi:hypothetical protein
MVNQLTTIFQKTLKHVQDYETFCSQSPHTLIAMFAVLNLRCGAMKIKQPALAVVLNGTVQTITQLVFLIANTQTNAEQ